MDIKKAIASGRKDRLYNLILPGFGGVPISHVISFVIKGFRKGVLVTRASSIAFKPAYGYFAFHQILSSL